MIKCDEVIEATKTVLRKSTLTNLNEKKVYLQNKNFMNYHSTIDSS